MNTLAFSKLTEQSAYWIGFLMADGCIRGNSVCLGLASIDHRHVLNFKKFIKSKNPVKKQRYTSNFGTFYRSTFQSSSREITMDLKKFGVVPRKTGHENLPPEIQGTEFERHFWRGMIDGDGTVGLYFNRNLPYPDLILGGCLNVCRSLNQFAHNQGLKTSKIGTCRGLKFVRFNGAPAKKLIEILYQDCTTFLDRKMKTSKKCLKWRPRIRGQARRLKQKLVKQLRTLESLGDRPKSISTKLNINLSTVKKYIYGQFKLNHSR